MKKLLILGFQVIFMSCCCASGFFVAADATITGDGSYGNPWPFQTALNHPAILHPGDTIWLRGGLYTNNYDAQTSFSCFTNGTADAPIIFRNFERERVTIDGELLTSLYLGLGNCSYTWFWGIEVMNSASTDRNHDIPGGITCTAENMKFINLIVHDTGSGIDCWKTAKNAEIYGCLVYHIGNNLNNNGNLEGHGHGMYLQNDTTGLKTIHNNIIFSNYGYGIKVWQTTTTSAIGNFDFRQNIVFNGGSSSENLGGVGNNSRTHNFFIVANGENNPIRNTTIKHNYTFSGNNTPRPPVNAFGLNYGVTNFILDSNYLTCQTRLGLNNTPIFDASVKGNKIIGGIPPVYGVYLWGFTEMDFPQNTYLSELPVSGLEYFVLPNKYEKGLSHLAIYNWDILPAVQVDISASGLKPGDKFELINPMDYYNDIISGTYDSSGIITVPMTGHTFVQAVGSQKVPVSQFPQFGAFVIRKQETQSTTGIAEVQNPGSILLFPNPSNGRFTIKSSSSIISISIFNVLGERMYFKSAPTGQTEMRVEVEAFPSGVYLLLTRSEEGIQSQRIYIQ